MFSITIIIIIITVLVSIGGFSNHKIIDDLIFYPPAVTYRRQWYRFFSCGLIHADIGHLFFNMFSFYFFGNFVEGGFETLFGDMGKWLYLLLYVSALLVSLLPTYFKHKDSSYYRSLGASGAVSAIIFAGVLLAPDQNLYIYFIRMPAFIFAPLYLIVTAWLDRRGGSGINHSAHLWGSIYGLIFTLAACQYVGYPVVKNAIALIKVRLHLQ